MATFGWLHDDRAATGVLKQSKLFFEQFHVLGPIPSGVRRKEIQTSWCKSLLGR